MKANKIAMSTSSVQVHNAIMEMLHLLIDTNCKGQSDINVSIRATKKYKPHGVSDMWFYIKVMTSRQIQRNFYTELPRNSSLTNLLTEMESLENESHLCVQFPHMYQRCKDQSDICQGNVTGGQGQMIEGQCQAVECQSGVGSLCIECQRTGCLQQNLKLGNGTLVVHEEAFIDKDIWNTTLHLRVNASLTEMLGDCKQIINSMHLLKICRPKVAMSFSMKIGEVKSETDFRTEALQKLPSPCSCEIVNDTDFLLRALFPRSTDMAPVESSTHVYQSDPGMFSAELLDEDNNYNACLLQVVTMGQFIPVDGTSSCSVTLTLFGPGFFPVHVGGNRSVHLLWNLAWQKYGLKVVTDMYEEDDLQYQQTVQLRTSRRHNSLGPFVLVLYLYIAPLTTVDSCFARFQFIQDHIVKIMNNEHHFVKSLENIVEKVLLPAQAKAKTQGLIQKCIQSACKAVTDIVSMSTNEAFRQHVLDLMQVPDTVDLHTALHTKLCSISQKRHGAAWKPSLLCTQGKSMKCDSPQEPKETDCYELSENKKQNNDDSIPVNISTSHEMILPSPGELIQDMSKSTFQQYGARFQFTQVMHSSASREADYTQDSVTPHPGSAFIDNSNIDPGSQSCVKVDKSNDGISPFHQLADTPTLGIDLTPDTAKITVGIEQVSPFQELAVGEKDDYLHTESLQEDPHMPVISDLGDYNIKLPKRIELLETHPDNGTSGRRNMNALKNSQNPADTDIEISKQHKIGLENKQDTTVSMKDVEPEGRACFELMASEEFSDVFDIVSAFIDDVNDTDCELHEGVVSDAIDSDQSYVEGKLRSVCHDKAEDGKKGCPQFSVLEDSDGWFEDVLMDVENWLN